MMDIDTFLKMPTAEVATLVREHGPKVCVFPINGTRRWFLLEYPERAKEDFVASYLKVNAKQHLELYRLFFDHGVDTLLTPVFGPDLLERNETYDALLKDGLVIFAEDEGLLAFYEAYGVRVRVYGDAERYLANTIYADALDTYEELTQRTQHHDRHCLFFGVCAHDAAETVASIGHRFYQDYGRVPSKQEIIKAYYGESVGPVDLFIGADRPAAFDMPLISTGAEDLYFTVAPSPYMDARTLRTILYDHMYARRVDDTEYHKLSPADWQRLGEFYRRNQHAVLGLGRQDPSGQFWYPIPQVKLTSDAISEPQETS
jgi:tuberculosinol/isotuberculosinol synthase